MKRIAFALSLLLAALCLQAQVIQRSDLEKYTKERFGDKLLEAASNIAASTALDKNQGIAYQQVIESPGCSARQLYVTMYHWALATFRDKQAIVLNDREAGCIIVWPTMSDIVEHTGTINAYSVSISPIIRIDIKDQRVRVSYSLQSYDVLYKEGGGWLGMHDDDYIRYIGDMKRLKIDLTNPLLYDEQWVIGQHYPYVEKDAQKRTCAKALVMAYAYSNVLMDKVVEAVRNGVIGNEHEDW